VANDQQVLHVGPYKLSTLSFLSMAPYSPSLRGRVFGGCGNLQTRGTHAGVPAHGGCFVAVAPRNDGHWVTSSLWVRDTFRSLPRYARFRPKKRVASQ
jgi:hypothetical protein